MNGKLSIDGIGIALIGLGSAALEVLLDRGQIDDWFGSRFIVWMFVIGLSCIVAAIFWELHVPDPVIDFRLLKVRNFAIANLFYFVFGFGLFASTTMIPQLLQSLYGYRAIDAGLVLGPGALVITFLAPVGAQLVQRGLIKPRILLFGAVMVVGISFIHYSHFNLDTDYRTMPSPAPSRASATPSSSCRSRSSLTRSSARRKTTRPPRSPTSSATGAAASASPSSPPSPSAARTSTSPPSAATSPHLHPRCKTA